MPTKLLLESSRRREKTMVCLSSVSYTHLDVYKRQAVINTAKVEPGAKAIVFGLGGIGLNVIQGLRLAGADMIIGVDLNPDKKAWGERFGMTHFVNPKDVGGDLVAHLVNMTKSGADQIGGAD